MKDAEIYCDFLIKGWKENRTGFYLDKDLPLNIDNKMTRGDCCVDSFKY